MTKRRLASTSLLDPARLAEGIGIALESIRVSKARAALTILGVAIGVMVVIAMASMITGITRGTTAAHLCRAALEAIALQNVDLVRAMEADADRPINNLRVDGGAAANNLLLQIQADLLGVQIFRPEMVEATALGAAKLAARGIGIPRPESSAETTRMDLFNPTPGTPEREALRERWRRSLRAVVTAVE